MSLFGDYFILPFFDGIIINSYHEAVSDRAVVKRRRKLEEILESNFPVIGDDDIEFLSEQYRQKLLMMEKEVKLLKSKIKLLQSYGRFDHSELFDLYERLGSAVKNPKDNQNQ